MTRAIFQETCLNPDTNISIITLLVFSNATSSKGASRVRVHSPEHPLELGHASTRRLRLPWQQNAGVCQVAPVTGGALGGDLGMNLPYLTRPELCVTQP